jgi:HD-like signal output (HDOD) protein
MNEPEFEKQEAELDYRLSNPMTSVKELAEVIDPNEALKKRVIARANSALYGSRRKVENLMQAIVLIGFRNVRSIVAEMKSERSKPPARQKEIEADM